MRILTFILLLWIPFSVSAEDKAEDDMSAVIEMMVVAKATGMCGVFSQMANFQEATKMAGGDEFVVRFIKTEAVRLGHTLESFMAQCPPVIEKYNSTMKLLGYQQ
jgi:hypothetical protein